MVQPKLSSFLPHIRVRSPGEKVASIIDRSRLERLDLRRLRTLGEGDDLGGVIGEKCSVNGSSEEASDEQKT